MTAKKTKPIKVLHISAECYPAAKAGGLGDVVGALPKYLQKSGLDVHVVIPKYSMDWFANAEFYEQYVGYYWNPTESIHYSVQKLLSPELGFHFYAIEIPGKFDRNGVYKDQHGYFGDETERWLAFQRSALDWIHQWEEKPNIIHSHDHHCGLITFMIRHCYKYGPLQHIPSVFTIHNESYQGAFGWSKQFLLPRFDTWKSGLLDWDHRINSLACGVKCADRVTTVSPSFMQELQNQAFGLESLFSVENYKSVGLLNGIDSELWDPATDPSLTFQYIGDPVKFKEENKKHLCNISGLNSHSPMIGFIGRMVYQKGADILARCIYQILRNGREISFVILGTGDKSTEHMFHQLAMMFPDKVGVSLSYDETMAHRIYAGSDFLIMPSRTEPCGLNQMYAMRYGSIPVVHHVGGLKDSVKDYRDRRGTGIKFYSLDDYSVQEAIIRASEVYKNEDLRKRLLRHCFEVDFSWDKSAESYIKLYEELI